MLGFLILSHNNPAQLQRLTSTLRHLYDDAPIAVHHDFHQTELDRRDFSGVHFVEQPVRTDWGKWSLVEGTLIALRLLYETADPDWFMLLSESDYPIAQPQDVLADLATSSADALMDYREIPYRGKVTPVPGTSPCHAQHGNSKNTVTARNRYLKAIVKIPIIRTAPGNQRMTPGFRPRLGAYTTPVPFPSPFSPYSDDFRCYVGSQWFTARREVARFLLEPSERAEKLARHLRKRVVPDETYFQTLIVNEDRFTVDPDPRRYTDWGEGGWGPKTMKDHRLEDATRMGMHFARKFEPGSPLLDRIDERLVPISASEPEGAKLDAG